MGVAATSGEAVFKLTVTGQRGGRRRIPIGFTKVADDTFTRDRLTRLYWSLGGRGYACRRERQADGSYKTVMLHQIVFAHYHGALPPGTEIDHADRDKLNNLPSNLRAVPHHINMANRGSVSSTGYRGVRRSGGRFAAQIHRRGRGIHLGCFATAAEAAVAVNEAYSKHFPGVQLPNPTAATD